MFNLQDPNISYLIISPEKDYNHPVENHHICERLCSVLYSKDYTLIPLQSYFEGSYDKSFIAISPSDNDSLRMDSLFLIDMFEQKSVVVKYRHDTEPTKINSDGSERPMSVLIYESNTLDKIYLYNGWSFCFHEKKRYQFPKKKEELKNGMMIEYFNNNKWSSKRISNIDSEYEKMYKLLMKYEKLRIECL